MKVHVRILLFILLICRPGLGISQNDVATVFKPTAKGNLFIHWGYNRSGYTTSDISFEGPGYDFELKNVAAKDRQSSFDLKTYFGPTTFTIPQYNFVVGYFIKDGVSLSFNADHMKYVMVKDQISTISGYIDKENSSYAGTFEGERITLSPEFLYFEHTDGLNYSNIELTKYFNLWTSENTKVSLDAHLGLAAGILIPRSNVRLLGEGSDQFHLAGFGTSADGGVWITFFKRWVFQYKVKSGYINMPDIVINGRNNEDRAKQDFWFWEHLCSLGAIIPINSKK